MTTFQFFILSSADFLDSPGISHIPQVNTSHFNHLTHRFQVCFSATSPLLLACLRERCQQMANNNK